MKTVFCRQKGSIFPIVFPVVGIIMLFIAAVSIYAPTVIQLQSTSHAYVTSTSPNIDTNYFYDDSTVFHTTLALRNCTLLERRKIGIVKYKSDDETVSQQSLEVLEAVFDEINEAYQSAYKNQGKIKFEP